MDAVAELYIIPAAEAAVELPSAQALSAKELELREREIALREREMLAQERRWETEMELKRAEYDRMQKIDAEKVMNKILWLRVLRNLRIRSSISLLK